MGTYDRELRMYINNKYFNGLEDIDWWNDNVRCKQIVEEGYDTFRINKTRLLLFISENDLEFVGMDIETLLEENHRRSEIQEFFLEELRKIGFTRELRVECSILYGMWGSG